MDVKLVQAKLLYIKENINELMREVMGENEDLQKLALDLNRRQLQVQGIDSNGNRLGDYADRTRRLREAAGLQTGFIDLKFSGDFQNQFIIKDNTRDIIFSIDSENWKRDILVEGLRHRKGFGEDIFGLTAENLEILKREMHPHLKAKIAQILNA